MASSSTTLASPITGSFASLFLAEKRMITLKSSDGKPFTVDEATAFQSEKLKSLLGACDDEQTSNDAVIKKVIKNKNNNNNNYEFGEDSKMTSEVLEKVIEYCKKHSEYQQKDNHTTDDEKQLEKWDHDFIQGLANDLKSLFDVMLAANYLEIKSLLELSSQCAADSLKEMSVEEIREMFGIINDFTPEEEEELLKEKWIFQ